MGQAYSKYKSEREEKARNKRTLIKQLVDLGEYIERMQQERQRLENRLIDEEQAHPPDSKPETPGRICLTNRTIDIYRGRAALVKDISVKEKVLNVSKQKYDSMKDHLSRLQKDRDDLERENSKEKSKLAASKERLKAFHALRLKKGSPLDTWTVCSVPNLHFKKVTTLTKRRKA